MTAEDKVGADAGLVVTVHDYDPVRPEPPRPKKKQAKTAEPDGGDE